MPTVPYLRFIRAVMTGVVGLLGVAMLGSGLAAAQVPDSGITSDSEIELLQRAWGGAYERYLINVTAREGRIVLATDKDGVKAQFEVNSNDYLALWRGALKNGLEKLVDASPSSAEPDQSEFTVRYRVMQTTGRFTVYGAETLSDGRYRTIVEAILTFADTYSRQSGR